MMSGRKSDASIAFSVTDNLSQSIVGMKNSVNSFRADVTGLQERLDALDHTRVRLKNFDLKEARSELTRTKAALDELGEAATEAERAAAQADFDKAVQNYANVEHQLSMVSKQARQVEKDMLDASSAISKADNRAGAGAGQGGSSMLAALGKAGLGQMAGDAAQEVANLLIGSAFGDEAGGVLSSGLSGTYNMVRLQAGQRDDLEIAVFDSRSGSLGIGIMVLQLWEEIVAGASWETLVRERAPHLVANTFPFFSVDTLEYLRRGGRIGRITALAGTMLSIKPIITFSDDGQLQSIAKVRGRRQVQDKILELLRARFQSGRRYNLAVANGGAPEEMAEFAARLKAEFPNYEHFWEGVMDATLSVYIGDGVIGGGIQFLD